MNSALNALLWISCDLSNGSLYFLSQIVDHLEIFIWVCGLYVLVGCARTGWLSHFGWLLGHLVLSLLCRLVQHANFGQISAYHTILVCRRCSRMWAQALDGRSTHFGMPWQWVVRSIKYFWSTKPVPGCEPVCLFGRPIWFDLPNQTPVPFCPKCWVRFWGSFLWLIPRLPL